MNVIVDIAIIPIGVGVSLSRYVAACETILVEAGLKPLIQIKKQEALKRLRGKLRWDGDLDAMGWDE